MRRLIPWSYPMRSLFRRWQAALFSALGIAMTVAVLCGVFALRDGFAVFMAETGSDDVVVYLRPGATSEGESGITLRKVQRYVNTRPEIAKDENGAPLAAGESYLALFLDKADGVGRVNVPIRGVEDASFAIHGKDFWMVDGRRFTPGANEIIVGQPISTRIKNCKKGDTLIVNTTPFEVVGVFEHTGAYRSEIWGDVERIAGALERPVRQRVVARMKPGTDVEQLREDLKTDKELPSKVQTEREYFLSQTNVLGGVLTVLGVLLTSILGIAAVLGATNTMLAAVGARMHEIGILRSVGYGGPAILIAFLVEAVLVGLVGGILGALIVLPLDGLETGTMNWNTFTETTFAFRVDPPLLGVAVGVAVLLGLVGGILPAWRASRMKPVDAIRRG
ncbi:MAG: ABC transporter permease [Planctomycetota bacterium]|nr:ABC transporter permease [Planctomycetota bacterium]